MNSRLQIIQGLLHTRLYQAALCMKEINSLNRLRLLEKFIDQVPGIAMVGSFSRV